LLTLYEVGAAAASLIFVVVMARWVDAFSRSPWGDQSREYAMSSQDIGDRENSRSNPLNRRNILLGGTTFAAASAIAANSPAQVAQAQPPAPSGKKPNILVIFGDDIGQTNLAPIRSA
jgi:hypothetical protein